MLEHGFYVRAKNKYIIIDSKVGVAPTEANVIFKVEFFSLLRCFYGLIGS
jgi:hypothetical protein